MFQASTFLFPVMVIRKTIVLRTTTHGYFLPFAFNLRLRIRIESHPTDEPFFLQLAPESLQSGLLMISTDLFQSRQPLSTRCCRV